MNVITYAVTSKDSFLLSQEKERERERERERVCVRERERESSIVNKK